MAWSLPHEGRHAGLTATEAPASGQGPQARRMHTIRRVRVPAAASNTVVPNSPKSALCWPAFSAETIPALWGSTAGPSPKDTLTGAREAKGGLCRVRSSAADRVPAWTPRRSLLVEGCAAVPAPRAITTARMASIAEVSHRLSIR